MATSAVLENLQTPFYRAVNEYLLGMEIPEGPIRADVLARAIQDFCPETRVKIKILLRSAGRLQ